MATTNISVSATWTKVVNAADSFLLSALSGDPSVIEVAISPASASVSGHRLNASTNEGMTRDLIGPGDVYVRSTGLTRIPGVAPSAALTTWTA